MQCTHHRATAQFRFPALRKRRDQPALLYQGRKDQGCLVLRAQGARRNEGVFQDKANPEIGIRTAQKMVEQTQEIRCRLESLDKGTRRERLQSRHQESHRPRRRNRIYHRRTHAETPRILQGKRRIAERFKKGAF